MSSSLPERAERLLRWSLAPGERPAILGDLEEEFASIAQAESEDVARRWYWRQVLRSVWSNLWRRVQADPRRHAQFHRGLGMIAMGLLWIGPVLFRVNVSTTGAVCGPAYLIGGSGQVAVALFRKRLTRPQRQSRILAWLLIPIWVAVLVVAQSQKVSWSFWLWTNFFIGLGLLLWPYGRSDAPVEVRVAPKGEAQNPTALWPLELPAEPLGLSGLVLHHRRLGTPNDATRLPPVTIERKFTPEDKVRVRAAVNLSARGGRASVEVLDRQGRQVWQISPALNTGRLVEVPTTPDDIADRDPAEHFGLIDQTVDLAMLSPGPYRLRVTVSNELLTSSREEQIVVADFPRR